MSNNNNILSKDAAVMKQLDLRAYSREEIADVLDVNIKDVNHFKRNVESKLLKWGYSYEYSRKAVTITRVPTTAEEKLSEIMIRAFDMDVRIDAFSFAAFLYSLVVFPEFASMPWEERSKFLKDEFKIDISDRTLRSWCSKFIETNTLIKDSDNKTRWITGYLDGEKYRDQVDGDEELEKFVDVYNERRKELLEEYKDEKPEEKWKTVRSILWQEYHCCVYCCKSISLAAWGDSIHYENLQEVLELVTEIAEREPVETSVVIEQSIITTPVKQGEFIF